LDSLYFFLSDGVEPSVDSPLPRSVVPAIKGSSAAKVKLAVKDEEYPGAPALLLSTKFVIEGGVLSIAKLLATALVEGTAFPFTSLKIIPTE
jgi:hypothetical protein